MAVRNLNWYNLQSTRRYPLDDSCTGEDDNGKSLLNDILVDCHLRFSEDSGKYAYVQAITISAGLVTVIIGASHSLSDTGTSIAAVTIPKPVSQNINYAVTSFSGDTAGWLVFGGAIDGPDVTYRFTYPQQSLLAARCARAFSPLPIPSMKKLGVGTALKDIVNIVGETPLLITTKTEVINDIPRQLIVFSLNTSDTTLAYNPLSYFLGTCGQRPESGTCSKVPIATINGISPDCFGNIDIVFDSSNMNAQAFEDCGGIDITTTYGLNKSCEGKPTLPPFYSDLCCPLRFESEEERLTASADTFSAGDFVRVGVLSGGLSEYTYYRVESLTGGAVTWSTPLAADNPDLKTALAKCDWPNPTDIIPDIVINLPSIQDYPSVQLPACIDFCSCDPVPPLFDAVQGVFSSAKTPAPFGCVPCGLEGSTPPSTQADMFALNEHNTYLAVDTGAVALSLFKNSASDWAFGRVITTQLKIGADGLDRNGGIVINYRKVNVNGIEQTRYFAATIDVGRGQMRLLNYINNSYTVYASVPMPVKTNQWYKMSVHPSVRGVYVYLNIIAEEMTADGGTVAQIIDYRIPLADYEPQTGAFGLYTERSYTYFNAFMIA